MERKRFGDRRDGRRVRDVDGLHTIMMHLMPKRTEAEVYQLYTVDVTELQKYLAEKNAANPDMKTTVFHCVIAGVGRLVRMRPYLNRFICGRKLYQRDDITLSFVAKRKFQDHAEESLMVVDVKDDTCLSSITRKIVGDVQELRKETADGNSFDDLINAFGRLPGFLLRIVFAILQHWSRAGLLPAALTEGDTNHTSVLLSNLGSIQCDSCYHHLNNYGTNSIMITVGMIHKEPRLLEDGTMEFRDVMNLGFTADERIADGFYFAKSLKLLDHLLSHPELLEIPIGEEIPYEL